MTHLSAWWYLSFPAVLLLVCIVYGYRAARAQSYPFSLLKLTSIHDLDVTIVDITFRFLATTQVLILCSTMIDIWTWPDSTAYLYANAVTTSILGLIVLLHRRGVLSLQMAGRSFCVIMTHFLIMASYVSASPDPLRILLDYMAIPAVFPLFAVISSVMWALGLFIYLGCAMLVMQMGLLPAVSEPWMCLECMHRGCEGLGAVMAISTLLHMAIVDMSAAYKGERIKEIFRKEQEVKDEFVAILSHDIKTPLNGIIGCASMLEKARGLSRSQKDQLAVIRHCSAVLGLLVENVLAHGGSRVGKRDHVQLEDLQSFFKSYVSILQTLAYQKEVTVALEMDPALPAAWPLDHRLLLQVLLNLGSNSIKFDGRHITVLVIYLPRENQMRIEVQDRGIGISSEFAQSQLFEPYSREQKSKVVGTGLGLSICKKLCEIMDAEFGYVPNPGGGSVFYIVLPYAAIGSGGDGGGLRRSPRLRSRSERNSDPWTDVAAFSTLEEDEGSPPISERQVVAVAGEAGAMVPSPRGGRGLEVLVVDDSPVNVQVLQMLLKQMKPLPITIAAATDGAGALQYLLKRNQQAQREQLTPVLVLMDLAMPILDGNETAKYWRHLEYSMGVDRAYIYAVSAGMADRADNAYFDGLLPKPVKLADLRALIQQTLDQI